MRSTTPDPLRSPGPDFARAAHQLNEGRRRQPTGKTPNEKFITHRKKQS